MRRALVWCLTAFIHLWGFTADKVGNGIHWGSFIGTHGPAGGGMIDEGNAESLRGREGGICHPSGFQMPLHYPRYKKSDYEIMEEWKLDKVLKEYGLSFKGTLDEKRAFAMGTFLWPDQMGF